jgi:CRP/FNR family transcriptional regulator, nitrogen oxide reductase regulator
MKTQNSCGYSALLTDATGSGIRLTEAGGGESSHEQVARWETSLIAGSDVSVQTAHLLLRQDKFLEVKMKIKALLSSRCTQCPDRSQPRCLQCVERSHLFAAVSATELAEIVSAARPMQFTRGHTIFNAGDKVQNVMLLTEGSVKVTQIDENGNEVILRLVEPGEIVGPFWSAKQSEHDSTAEARASCKSLVWEMAAFEALSRRFPALQLNMLRILADYTHEVEARFCEISTKKVPQRLARQLTRLLPQVGRKVGEAVEINLSREELAKMTATTLFSVSRQLSIWQRDGVVSPKRLGLLVRNTRALMEISKLE